jgi:flagellar hook-associated protein 1 FlgK
MAGISVLNIAASALATTRAAMDVSANNVANASTPGYSRQRVIIGDLVKGGGAGANGVGVESTRRNASELIERQRRTTSTALAQAQTLGGYLGSIDGLMGAPDEGIAKALNGFYSSVNDVAREPENRAYRAGLLNSISLVKDIYSQLDARLGGLRDNVLAERKGVVDRINQISQALAGTNTGIELDLGAGREASPSLLDQRDNLLLELSKLNDVEVNIQNNGTVNVKAMTGANLVTGVTASALANTEIGSGGTLGALDQLLKGELGAVTATASGRLAALNTIKTNSANEFFEVTDSTGKRFYTRTLAIGLNPLDLKAENQAKIVDQGMISDTRVSLVSPEGYSVSGADPVTKDRVAATVRFDTLGLSVDNVEAEAARDLTDDNGTVLFEAGNVTPAGTVRTTTPAVTPVDGQQPTLGTPVETVQPFQLYVVRFNNPRGLTDLGNGYFAETDNARKDTNSPVTDPVTTQDTDAREAAFQTSSTWARLRGVYEGFKADVFQAFGTTVDNLKVDDISEFELPKTLSNGTETTDYQLVARAANSLLAGRGRTESDMTRLTGEVGQRKVSNDAITTTLTSMSTQIESERSLFSGVSMDEEALDLVRLQQAYAGAAKVVDVANKMFDTLIAAL